MDRVRRTVRSQVRFRRFGDDQSDWNDMIEIIVAAIGFMTAVLVALIQRSRKENRRDHGSVLDRLDLVSSEIRKDIRQVRSDLTQVRTDVTQVRNDVSQTRAEIAQHINDHATGVI